MNVRLEMPEPSRHLAATWTRSIGGAADGAQVEEAIVAILLRLDVALYPVIGKSGVAALYQRSLHLSVPAHAFLADACAGAGAGVDMPLLRATISRQGRDDAVAAAATLLDTFDNLLGSLIGPALAGQLLRPVWDASPGETRSHGQA